MVLVARRAAKVAQPTITQSLLDWSPPVIPTQLHILPMCLKVLNVPFETFMIASIVLTASTVSWRTVWVTVWLQGLYLVRALINDRLTLLP